MKALLRLPFLALLRVYRYGISPFLPGACRFHPTCSEYAHQAITIHGVGRGGWLALHRICRCHPWGGSGIDTVPDRKSE